MSTDTWVRDQLEIRQLIERYFDAVNRRRSEEIMQLWAEECRWSVPDMAGLENVTGKAAIRENFEAAQQLFPLAFVVGTPGSIDIDGDAASTRVYTAEVLENREGAVRHAVGVYEDTLRRVEGRWLFRERIWRMSWQHAQQD